MADADRSSSSAPFDLVLVGGTVYDGTGAPPYAADVAIQAGRVAAIGVDLPCGTARVVDCRGKWVTPGFIDLHTHYDAEIEVAPGLSESVRHGVTSVVLGSCSLSMAVGAADDLADMFCRVEGMPDAVVRRMIHDKKQWATHRDYLEHLDALPLGPNVACLAGHSTIRAHVMGLEASATARRRMTAEEDERQLALVEDALDAGYLGVSVQTLPWDKLGGDKGWRSRPLPSTFAPWSEVKRIARVLRQRGAVLQGVPNISTKWNVILFLLASTGLLRKRLKTTVVSMMDLVSSPGIHRVIGVVSRFFNTVLRADFRWQALPEVFDLYADGLDLVVFEEFGAGAAALHIIDDDHRAGMLRSQHFRKRFKREWKNVFSPRAFHRKLHLSRVVACPDTSLVGKTFTDIAEARGVDEVDAFLDLVAQYGKQLRWFTVMGNERERSIGEIAAHPDVLIGFSDAGAHLRSMAHYNFPLRLLRHVLRAERAGRPFMTVQRAVQRCTSEIADWMGFDAGRLGVGARADVVVVDPRGLDDRVEEVHEATIPALDDFSRLVRRNDEAVPLVLIGGVPAVEAGVPTAALGARKLGRVLRRTGTGGAAAVARAAVEA